MSIRTQRTVVVGIAMHLLRSMVKIVEYGTHFPNSESDETSEGCIHLPSVSHRRSGLILKSDRRNNHPLT